VAQAEGLLASVVLIFLQFLATWSFVRSRTLQRLVKNEPKLLFYEGRFLRDAMRADRVIEEEVEAAMQQQGLGDLKEIGAAVLETDGTMTVVPRGGLESASALRGMAGQPPDEKR
jgi:uncharacterized membrane protein YcaP (DUF421 family)